MAGFLENDTTKNISTFQRIRESIKGLSNFGMRYDDMVVKNSQAIGVIEAKFLKEGGVESPDFLFALGVQDTSVKQYISYFDKDYAGKRDYLRKFAMNPEIEFILDTVSDEAITYDSKNFFAYPAFLNISEMSDDVKTAVNERYKKLYNYFRFTDSITAWQYFRKFLVDGFLSFEIVYDDEGKEIIGFKELDPNSLIPSVIPNPDGTYTECWIQYPQDNIKKRILYDSQVVYISYAKGNYIGRVSYTERLIRPYNILRIVEQSRVIWTVMNSSFKMKMTVPIGTSSPQKAKQTLGELLSIYKEDVQLNDDTGDLLIDGSPKIQFYKNYLIPKGINGEPTIEAINQGDGPNLNDPKPLEYFFEKLKQESKIPYSRFNGPDGGSTGTFSTGAEGMDKEEVRFSKFINRLRSVFQEIMIKPLWIQMCLDYPELKKDYVFKSQLGLDFVSDNYYSRTLEMDSIIKRKEAFDKLKDLKGQDGTPYFSLKFLVDRYLGMEEDDRLMNERYKKKAAEEEKKKTKGKKKPEKGGEEELGGFKL
jgi:hypothetical protein